MNNLTNIRTYVNEICLKKVINRDQKLDINKTFVEITLSSQSV